MALNCRFEALMWEEVSSRTLLDCRLCVRAVLRGNTDHRNGPWHVEAGSGHLPQQSRSTKIGGRSRWHDLAATLPLEVTHRMWFEPMPRYGCFMPLAASVNGG